MRRYDAAFHILWPHEGTLPVPTFSADVLTRFAADLLDAGGLSRDDVAAVSESLVGANLRGYDSHGLMRIPQYLAQVEKGEIISGAQFEVLNDTPALLTTDGHWGFGQVQAGHLI